MPGWLRRWRENRIIRRSDLGRAEWADICRRLHALQRLDEGDRERLRQLVMLFLHDKQIHGAGGAEPDRTMRLVIAAQASLPVLNLGLDWYAGWHSVLVYPEAFVAPHEVMDEDGVVHVGASIQAGESWDDGPVILAWDEVMDVQGGCNLVIHEFAHKLDAANGVANGMPPLHRGMDRKRWTDVFSSAWEDFSARVDDGEAVPIDPYAAEAPEEFFAVFSESFFENPRAVRELYPDVYEQLRQFYRQDPLGD